MKKHKNITRVKTGSTDGWQVRVEREGVEHSRLFSLTTHQGSRKALKAAIVYRDRLLAQLPKPKNRVSNRDTSIGVRKYANHYGGNTPTEYWVASWVDPATKKPRNRKFRISKYGNAKAKKLAKVARRLGIDGLRQQDERQRVDQASRILAIRRMFGLDSTV